MASKFRITAHRAGHTLKLRLSGDLDGSSACEILNYIRNHNVADKKILIHGMAINRIHPFGLHVLQEGLKEYDCGKLEVVLPGTDDHERESRSCQCDSRCKNCPHENKGVERAVTIFPKDAKTGS
jgi:hypothetical protein